MAGRLTGFLREALDLQSDVSVLFYEENKPWSCWFLEQQMLGPLEQKGFRAERSEEGRARLFPPQGSCFFVVSCPFPRCHRYAVHAVEALFDAKFEVAQHFTFQLPDAKPAISPSQP